jgi:serine/threonine-protein kinase
MSEANTPTISRYRVVSRLEGWSIGDAFQAFDPLLERHVLVELFSLVGVGADQSAEIKGVFYREMQRVAALAHPGIARLFDVGETADGLFATWEQVDGMRLDQALQSGAASEAPTALRWLKQIAGALEAAHLKGILHLGLSPASVFVDKTGDAKVVGFGMSPVVDLLSRAKGYEWSRSPYEAPERQSAASGTMRADWFSFGAIAREVVRASLGQESPALAEELDRVLTPDPVARTPSALPVLVTLEGEMRARGLVQGGDESAEKAGDSVTAVFNSIIEADRTPLPTPAPETPRKTDAGAVPAAAPQAPAPPVPKAISRRRATPGPWIAVVAATLVLAVAGLMLTIWARSPMLADLWNLARGSGEPAAVEPPPLAPSAVALAPAASEQGVPVEEPPLSLPESSPPPTAGAARESTGIIRVVTQPPGAAITIDGEARGVSPVRVEGLALGQHSVSASLAGHSVVRQSVELTQGTRSRAITLTLAPVAAPMGVLSISSTPPGAAIAIDGRAVGTTPSRLDVTAGRHVVRVERDGHAPLSREINVAAGQGETLEFALEPLAPPAAPAPAAPITFERVEVKPRQVAGVQSPEYPPVARLARQSGTVVLAWVVDERGGVTDIEVVQSTAKVFENAVLGWIRDIKFEPGQQGGKPVAVQMTRRFRFEVAR